MGVVDFFFISALSARARASDAQRTVRSGSEGLRRSYGWRVAAELPAHGALGAPKQAPDRAGQGQEMTPSGSGALLSIETIGYHHAAVLNKVKGSALAPVFKWPKEQGM